MFLAAITGNWGRPGGAFLNNSIGAPMLNYRHAVTVLPACTVLAFVALDTDTA